MTQEWAIAIFSLCMPATAAIWKWGSRRRDDANIWAELRQLRKDIDTKFANVDTKFQTLHKDVCRIALKVGCDLWGS